MEKKKISQYETKSYLELEEMQDAYFPLFTTNIRNTKIPVTDIAGNLIGDGITINIENNTINAKNTTYSAGDKIEINASNEIFYRGNIASAYSAIAPLSLNNDELYIDFYEEELGSKLNPVTFIPNKQKPQETIVVPAGNSTDSIIVTNKAGTIDEITRNCFCIDKFAYRINDYMFSSPLYRYVNKDTTPFTYKWANNNTDPNFKLLSPIEYTHTAIDNNELQYIIICFSYLQAMNKKEIIINLLNRPNDRTELWFFNDSIGRADFTIYEQGSEFVKTIDRNNYIKSIRFELNPIYNPPLWVATSDFDLGGANPPFAGKNPPFAGNINNIADAKKYIKHLYSSIRFIPYIDGNKIYLTSTVY